MLLILHLGREPQSCHTCHLQLCPCLFQFWVATNPLLLMQIRDGILTQPKSSNLSQSKGQALDLWMEKLSKTHTRRNPNTRQEPGLTVLHRPTQPAGRISSTLSTVGSCNCRGLEKRTGLPGMCSKCALNDEAGSPRCNTPCPHLTHWQTSPPFY